MVPVNLAKTRRKGLKSAKTAVDTAATATKIALQLGQKATKTVSTVASGFQAASRNIGQEGLLATRPSREIDELNAGRSADAQSDGAENSTLASATTDGNSVTNEQSVVDGLRAEHDKQLGRNLHEGGQAVTVLLEALKEDLTAIFRASATTGPPPAEATAPLPALASTVAGGVAGLVTFNAHLQVLRGVTCVYFAVNSFQQGNYGLAALLFATGLGEFRSVQKLSALNQQARGEASVLANQVSKAKQTFDLLLTAGTDTAEQVRQITEAVMMDLPAASEVSRVAVDLLDNFMVQHNRLFPPAPTEGNDQKAASASASESD
jgi:hypothetical protein